MADGTNVRRAVANDIEAIAGIEKQCFSAPWSSAALAESFENPLYAFFVAENGEHRVVGYIGVYQILDEGQITNIAVLPEYRRQGFGRTLLKAVGDSCYEHGAMTLLLEVRASNEPALSLYQSCGFRSVGRRKNYYTSPTEDAILMTQIL